MSLKRQIVPGNLIVTYTNAFITEINDIIFIVAIGYNNHFRNAIWVISRHGTCEIGLSRNDKIIES